MSNVHAFQGVEVARAMVIRADRLDAQSLCNNTHYLMSALSRVTEEVWLVTIDDLATQLITLNDIVLTGGSYTKMKDFLTLPFLKRLELVETWKKTAARFGM